MNLTFIFFPTILKQGALGPMKDDKVHLVDKDEVHTVCGLFLLEDGATPTEGPSDCQDCLRAEVPGLRLNTSLSALRS